MNCYKLTLKPRSAFATPLKGDTLFGQLCWAVRNRLGESRLTELLHGYTDNRPFAVVSDAFPAGYLPLPTLPNRYYNHTKNDDRKALKKKTWLSVTDVPKPLSDWQMQAVSDTEIAATFVQPEAGAKKSAPRPDILSETRPQPHNSINRQTHTTGEGFAPYSIEQNWYAQDLRFEVYLLSDGRLPASDLRQCFEDIGRIGYGKDASIGLGKFDLENFASTTLPWQDGANASLTLAPCAPQGQGYDGKRSYYQLFTRFGRHGDVAVHKSGQPFKNPVLLAQTAAVFGVTPPATGFIGQGLGGSGQLSLTLKETVQQGYAPVIGVYF